eukprot:g19730.t1
METAKGPRTDTRLASLLYRFCVKKEFGLLLPPRWYTFYPAAYKIGGEAGVGMGKSDVRDPTSWKVKAAFAISRIEDATFAGLYLGKESEKNGLRPWKAEGSILETLEAAVDTQSRLIQLSEHRFAPFRVFVRLLHWLRASEYQYLQVQHQDQHLQRGLRINFASRFLASLLRNTPFFVCYFFLPWTLFPLFTALFVVAVFAQNRKTNEIHTCCGSVGSPPPSAEDHRHAAGGHGQMTDMLVEDRSYFFSRRFVNVWGNDERAQSSATKKVLPFLKFFGIHRRRDGEPGFDFKRPPFYGETSDVQALLLWDDFVASSVLSVAVILLFGVLPSVFWIAWNYARWGVCELLAPFLIEWLCSGLGRSVAAVWGGFLAAAHDEHEKVAALVAEYLKARLTYDFFVRFLLALLHFFVACDISPRLFPSRCGRKRNAAERQLLSRLDPTHEKLQRSPEAGAAPCGEKSQEMKLLEQRSQNPWSDRLRGFYSRIPTWTDSSRLYLAALQREGVAEGHAWEKYMEFRLEMEAAGEGE